MTAPECALCHATLFTGRILEEEHMRRILFAATVGMLMLIAAPAWAAPVAIHVSPSSVAAGDTVTVSGSVGSGSECSSVTLISKAFVHTNDFAGLPAVFATVKPSGAFRVTTRIPSARAAGTYTITGRCGGGNLGVSATLVVSGGLPRTGPTIAPFLFAGLGLLGLGALALGTGRRGRHVA
jgi:hypothetical protein